MSDNILKMFILFGGIIALVGRKVINPQYVNYYMAVINVVSFIVSYNILFIDIYLNLKRRYIDHKDQYINVNSTNVIMLVYILIFVLNIVIWSYLFWKYFWSSCDYALINDALGILSLCLALTSDFISEFVVKGLSFLYLKCN